MAQHWHTVRLTSLRGSNDVTAEATPGADSPWFNGHFPGIPVLPGIAELSMVFDAVQERLLDRWGTLAISEIKKVRFRQLIKPDETILIAATPDEHDPLTFKFKVQVRGQAACSGTMVLVRDIA